MNIGYEAKRFFTNYTGLGNYSRFVIDSLSTFRSENNYYLYTPKKITNKDVNPILERKNVHVVYPPRIYKWFKLLSLWRSWVVSSHRSIKDIKVFHGLSQELPYGLPHRIPKVVTVHDLIFMRYPQFYKSIDVQIYKAKVKSACERADKIIAVSQQTAEDIKSFLKIDHSKIDVVYQGCHSIFRNKVPEDNIKRIKDKYQLPSEYILNLGTIEERKNVKVVVQALSMLSKADRLPLVVVGRKTNYFNEVVECARQLNVLDQVKFLHNADFLDFPAIYQGAKVFVYPSFFEGFGIPLIEAIESGTPVISSTGSCFIEAAGPEAAYIDPKNPEALAECLRKMLTDDALTQRMKEKSFQYIQKFRPEKIAEELHSVYTSLL
jgi:glycosyltransferase involved in cell wall biosynthesis